MNRQNNLERVVKQLKSYPDFPKPGILFQDIFSVMGNPEAAAALYAIIEEDCKELKGQVDAVCALDSRGFLFGPQIALQLQVPFVPIRKRGKLPGSKLSVKYELEYGTDELEVSKEVLCEGLRVLIVDDLLATGGSLTAAGKLMDAIGSKIVKFFVILELTELNARNRLPHPVHSIISL